MERDTDDRILARKLHKHRRVTHTRDATRIITHTCLTSDLAYSILAAPITGLLYACVIACVLTATLLNEAVSIAPASADAFECGALDGDYTSTDTIELRTALLASLLFEVEL